MLNISAQKNSIIINIELERKKKINKANNQLQIKN